MDAGQHDSSELFGLREFVCGEMMVKKLSMRGRRSAKVVTVSFFQNLSSQNCWSKMMKEVSA